MSKIAVIGTGYVGLSSGACFAHLGHVVACVDVVQLKIDNLNKGILPIVETGLKELVAEGVAAGNLIFTTDVVSAVKDLSLIHI